MVALRDNGVEWLADCLAFIIAKNRFGSGIPKTMFPLSSAETIASPMEWVTERSFASETRSPFSATERSAISRCSIALAATSSCVRSATKTSSRWRCPVTTRRNAPSSPVKSRPTASTLQDCQERWARKYSGEREDSNDHFRPAISMFVFICKTAGFARSVEFWKRVCAVEAAPLIEKSQLEALLIDPFERLSYHIRDSKNCGDVAF